MVRAVKDRLPVSLELVDSNGVVPMRLADRTFTVAHSYRRWMQKNILDCLAEAVAEDPLTKVKLPKLESLPSSVTRKWKPADLESLLDGDGISRLPIDHSVPPSPNIVSGGSHEADAKRLLDQFINSRLPRYGTDRNHPDEEATTGLSPHLHFGHIGAQ